MKSVLKIVIGLVLLTILTTALAVGLKVDVDALPVSLIAALKQGKVDLNSPATTLALLKLNSVVGLTGQ